jgi:hypothetical protein
MDQIETIKNWKKQEGTPGPYLNILAFYKEAITNNSVVIRSDDYFDG